MKTVISSLVADEQGATMTEYALLLALIAVAVIGALQVLGGNVEAVFTAASNELSTVAPAS